VSEQSISNEAVLRRSIEMWNKDDWEALEALWDPEGAIVAPTGWPEPGPRHGWTEIREQFGRIKDSWTKEQVEVLSVTDHAEERLLARVRWTVKGEASGAPLSTDMWMLCDFRDGLFTRIQYFLDREAAEAAAEEGAEE
jgi:ketosteroid isomerase-like protein